MTAPESAKGWETVQARHDDTAGGHGLDVAPDASLDGARAETRRPEDRAGGEPSNAPAAEQLYIFRWGNNEARAALKGRTCRIVARAGRGGMNTVLVEFLDSGEKVSTSLRSLKRVAA